MLIPFNALYLLVVLGQTHTPQPAGCCLANTAWQAVGLLRCKVGGLRIMFPKLGQFQ